MGVLQPRRIGDYRICTVVTAAPWTENSYVISHLPSGEQVIVDPGDNAEAIIETARLLGGDLRHILLTHGHHDHVGAAAAVCRHFQLACDIHQGDARLLRQAPLYAFRFAGRHIERPEPSRTFGSGAEFPFGPGSIRVVHTPGHTAGGVCFDFGEFTFTGDTLFFERVGRTDLPGGDAAALTESVTRLLGELPDQAVLFPGHGRPWTQADAAQWWRAAAGVAGQIFARGRSLSVNQE